MPGGAALPRPLFCCPEGKFAGMTEVSCKMQVPKQTVAGATEIRPGGWGKSRQLSFMRGLKKNGKNRDFLVPHRKKSVKKYQIVRSAQNRRRKGANTKRNTQVRNFGMKSCKK